MKDIFKEQLEAFNDREKLINNVKILETEKKKLLEKYDDRESKINSDIKYMDEELKKIDDTIKSFSSFWADDISKVLVRLFNEFGCGAKYVLVKKQFKIENRQECFNVIVNEKIDDVLFDENYFTSYAALAYHYYDNDKLVIVGPESSGVVFNNLTSGTFHYSSNFKLDLVNDFINYLINRKYNRDKYDLSLDEMNEALNEYMQEKKTQQGQSKQLIKKPKKDNKGNK